MEQHGAAAYRRGIQLRQQEQSRRNRPAAGGIRAGGALRRRGRGRSEAPARLRTLRNDVLLAATAAVYGATVLTYNRADFAVIRRVLPVRFMVPEPGS